MGNNCSLDVISLLFSRSAPSPYVTVPVNKSDSSCDKIEETQIDKESVKDPARQFGVRFYKGKVPTEVRVTRTDSQKADQLVSVKVLQGIIPSD